MNALAERKEMLLARIAVRRAECEMACTELAPRLALADRIWSQWKQLPPWAKAAVPIGMFAARKLAKSAIGGKMGLIASLVPVAVKMWNSRGEGTPPTT